MRLWRISGVTIQPGKQTSVGGPQAARRPETTRYGTKRLHRLAPFQYLVQNTHYDNAAMASRPMNDEEVLSELNKMVCLAPFACEFQSISPTLFDK